MLISELMESEHSSIMLILFLEILFNVLEYTLLSITINLCNTKRDCRVIIVSIMLGLFL